MELITKNSQVRKLVQQSEYKKALLICKDWNYANPTHRKKLQLGYECLVHPEFYKQLGIDTKESYEEAIRILIEVYGG